MDCTPYNNCSYRRALQGVNAAAGGLLGELKAQGALMTSNSTFAAAMIAYPSVSVGAAVDAWQRDFPGLELLISEYNADEASSWSAGDLGEGGDWMRDNADAGSHALHWASGVLAGVNSNGTVSGINYHSFHRRTTHLSCMECHSTS